MQNPLTLTVKGTVLQGYVSGTAVSVLHQNTFTAGVFYHLLEAGPLTAAQVTEQLFPMIPVAATGCMLQKLVSQGWLAQVGGVYRALSSASTSLITPLPEGSDLRLTVLKVGDKHFGLEGTPSEVRGDKSELVAHSLPFIQVKDNKREGMQYQVASSYFAEEKNLGLVDLTLQITAKGYSLTYNGKVLEEEFAPIAKVAGQTLDDLAKDLYYGALPYNYMLDEPETHVTTLRKIEVNGKIYSTNPLLLHWVPDTPLGARQAFDDLSYKRGDYNIMTEEKAQELWQAKPDYWEFAFEEVFPEF